MPRDGVAKAEAAAVKFVPIVDALALPRSKRARGQTVTVYALWDQRDGGIRYIGVTNKTLDQRLAHHLKHPTNGAMVSWFDALARAGRRPAIEKLETVPREEWEDAERGWIHWCRQRGDLLNVDRGGRARDSAGRLRPFKAGVYQPPAGKLSQDAQNDRWRSTGAGTSAEGRPRLVPVAGGVFRRAKPDSP